MANLRSFRGRVINIRNFNTNSRRPSDCNLIISILGTNNCVGNFIATPNTYFVNHEMIHVGDFVICFYEPCNNRRQQQSPHIYQASVIAIETRDENIILDYFNRNLVNQRKNLQLILTPNTLVVLTNGQKFRGSLGNHYLIVLYYGIVRERFTQIQPTEIIVLC